MYMYVELSGLSFETGLNYKATILTMTTHFRKTVNIGVFTDCTITAKN